MILTNYLKAMKFRFNKYPSHLILFVTARCNAICRHCFYWQNSRSADISNELTLAEIEKISRKMGQVKFLSITGGEPTLRNDIAEIISTFCINNQTDHIVLHTNGYNSEKIRDIAVQVASSNPSVEINVSVSIDGTTDVHDLLRGVPGSHAQALATLRMLQAEKAKHARLNITVNSCFNFYNQLNIRGLADYLFDNYAIDGYYVSYVRGDTFDKNAKNIDCRDYLTTVNYLRQKKFISKYYDNFPLATWRRALDFLAPQIVAETVINKKLIYPCMAGQSVIVVTETGEVKPCEVLQASFGNLRDNDFDLKKMLFSAQGELLKTDIRSGNCCCTWECAIMNNIIFNWRTYPRLLWTWLQLEYRKRLGD